ncbi:hypothetical protein JCM30760_03370 [Thiomicrorhabdus hydrogeniphila]
MSIVDALSNPNRVLRLNMGNIKIITKNAERYDLVTERLSFMSKKNIGTHVASRKNLGVLRGLDIIKSNPVNINIIGKICTLSFKPNVKYI